MPAAATIFVVEDEALIAMELCDRLTGLGYHVSGHSARGEQALEMMKARPPDLVLMDIRLAGDLSGLQTATLLHESRDVPIVFLTAYSDSEVIRQAGEAGSFGFLVKPFQEREIHATIQVALRRHAAEKELRETKRQLEEALAGVKRLQGLIPICMSCKSIRDPKDYWHQLEAYLSEQAGVTFSHGLCPTCFESQAGPE